MVQKMLYVASVFVVVGILMCSPGMVAAQAESEGEGQKAEMSKEEVTAEVPALDELHEVIYQLWHEAFPDKNYDLIKELLPQADELTANLDKAALPGILRDKQAAWDEGKGKLKAALAALHDAAKANDEEGMLKQTEAFHSSYEGLVRTIRPVVKALADFHEELYKLYHYYAPDYDLAKIREASAAMKDRIPALAESTLPKRVADRQEKFTAAVAALSTAVDELVKTAAGEDKDATLAAVEKVHTAYVQTEQIFD